MAGIKNLPATLAVCCPAPSCWLERGGGGAAQGHTDGAVGGWRRMAKCNHPSLPHSGATRSSCLGGISFQLFRPYYKLFFGHFARHVLVFSIRFLPTSPHLPYTPFNDSLGFYKQFSSFFPPALPAHLRSRIFSPPFIISIFKIIKWKK